MKGKYHIVVQNNRLRYELDIRRNITIIRGDSATGKTKLIDLLEQAADLGEGSGVEVLCDTGRKGLEPCAAQYPPADTLFGRGK